MLARTARSVLRRVPVVTRHGFASTAPRSSSAALAPQPQHPGSDLVRDTIEEMLRKKQAELQQADAHDDTGHSIDDQELKQRVDSFQSLFEEARLCVADCHETKDTQIEEEASQAIDATFQAFLELLEDFRSATALQNSEYARLREEAPANLKQLRQDYDVVLSRAQK